MEFIAGCGTNGFKTAAGWDSVFLPFPLPLSRVYSCLAKVTGLGTPKFDALLKAAFLTHGMQPPKEPASSPTGLKSADQLGVEADTAAGPTSGNTPVGGGLSVGAIIGIAIGAVILILAVIVGIVVYRRWSRKTKNTTPGGGIPGYGSDVYRPLDHPAPEASSIMREQGDHLPLLPSGDVIHATDGSAAT